MRNIETLLKQPREKTPLWFPKVCILIAFLTDRRQFENDIRVQSEKPIFKLSTEHKLKEDK